MNPKVRPSSGLAEDFVLRRFRRGVAVQIATLRSKEVDTARDIRGEVAFLREESCLGWRRFCFRGREFQSRENRHPVGDKKEYNFQ